MGWHRAASRPRLTRDTVAAAAAPSIGATGAAATAGSVRTVGDDCTPVFTVRRRPTTETQAGVEQSLALGQLIYDLRTEAGLSQRELAQRMGTTQSVISRLEEGGEARNRIDTLARVANALGRHLVVSFPEEVPVRLKDAVQVA